MTEREERRQYQQELQIEAPRASVFRALTEATDLSRWFAPRSEIEPRPGGAVLWEWEGHFSWPQRVEILEPGARLRTRYDSSVGDGAGGKQPLFIDFLLEGEGGTTTLRLVHSGFGADAAFDEEFDGIRSGWPIELSSLKLYCERHPGQDRQLAWSRAHAKDDKATVWQRLVGPAGLGCGAALSGLEPGADFTIGPADGAPFEGEVVATGPFEFCGIARSHGDAFLRLWTGDYGGHTHVWLWLAMYGQDPARVAEEQARFDRLLATACPERAEAAS